MTRSTVIWLGALVILALVLRIAFNIGVAYDEEADRYLYSGNDPWYHDRTIDHIFETGESLQFDPVINYPNGGVNPNPPLYDWTTALDAWFFDAAGVNDAVGLALNLNVAIWGALIVIPVFLIANMMWGRTAGIWAAFFMAVSAPHIQRSVFGFADHDAPAMFFIAVLIAALLKALGALHHREYVPSWKKNPMPGIKAAFLENRSAMMWAAIAGVAIGAVALTWKGYPYILGVMAVAFGFQLLVDHVKNKDSTALSLVYLIPVVLGMLIALPYYQVVGLGSTTIVPHSYVLYGMLAAAAILVPTRELPSIIVFPALFFAGVLGLLLLLLVFPAAGQLIFSGLGYFNQSKLYTTIAEAQRTELGFVAANFGFFTFLLAFWPLFGSMRNGFQGRPRHMLIFSWGLIGIFMAFAASRFVFNAAPLFAVLAGAGTARLMAAIGISEMGARIRNLARQGNPVGAFFKGLTPKTTTLAVVIAGALVLPNVWLGVDASMSREFESEKGLDLDRLGAFGVGFDVKSNGWLQLFDKLATYDQDLAFEDRPAFIAWWDYGHWATNIGKHPTVADPFQNHFEQAGRFLSSESEEEAMLWLTLLLWGAHTSNPAAASVWADYGIAARDVSGSLDDQFEAIQELQGPEAFEIYGDMMAATGQDVGYFGVDERMFPINIQNTGIFYAPVFLANKNPDDFMRFTYSDGQTILLDFEQYGVDADGNSYRLAEPKFTDQSGAEWVVLGNQAFRKGTEPTAGSGAGATGITVSPDMQLTESFANSMYARAFGHISAAQGAPGEGLSHWRAIHESLRAGGQIRSTVLLQYYEGHEVSGIVRDGNGAPLGGVDVTFTDSFGAGHAVDETDSQGRFTVLAPPGDDLSLTIRDGGSTMYSMAWEVLEDGGETTGVTVDVPFAAMAGRAYEDKDGDGAFTDGEQLAGVRITVNGKSATTAADGTYSLGGLRGGTQRVDVVANGYEATIDEVRLTGGETRAQDFVMTSIPSDVTITFEDGGQGVGGVPIRISGDATQTVTTNQDGDATTRLGPGTYTLTVDYEFFRDGQSVQYNEQRTLNIPVGGAPVAYTITAS